MQELLNKIKQAHEQGYTDKSLSLSLAKDKSYIAKIKKGVSTAKQAQLIKDIDDALSGEVFKSDAQIIDELSQKLSEAQDEIGRMISINTVWRDKYETEKEILKRTDKSLKYFMRKSCDIEEEFDKLHADYIKWEQAAIKYRNYTTLLSTALVLGILSFITYLFI